MNAFLTVHIQQRDRLSFRPQQGLTIMNATDRELAEKEYASCFRPQQGLTIMNPYLQNPDKH